MIQDNQEARKLSGLFLYPTIQKIQSGLLNLLFPAQCVECGRVDTSFCEHCIEKLQKTALTVHTHQRPFLNAIISTGIHQGILQSAVQALKYHNGQELAQHLAMRMVAALNQSQWTFDTIIPVPLHSSRIRERGYNQSQELASIISEQTGVNCAPDAMQRIRATQSQVTLNREERQKNMSNAFLAHAPDISHKIILLVDDVHTTGATIMACAQAAQDVGAKAVYGITVTTARI